MADFGKTAAEYTPAVVYSGQIGKIAKQIVEGENVPSLFDVFEKDEIDTGKDVEITVFESATGVAYDPKNPPANIPDPKGHTLYFTEYDEQVYPVFIDKWNIDKASISRERAEREAEVIVETLYDGERERTNAKNFAQLNAAVGGAPNPDGSVQIVETGSVPEVTDEATAREFVKAVKLVANGMRKSPVSYNPYGLKIPSSRVVLVVPYQTAVAVDVYLRSSVDNPEYLVYDVDDVVRVDASETNGAAYVVDVRYVQNRRRKYVYEEEPVFGTGGNVKAALVTSRMYAICPLFNGVRIKQGEPTSEAGESEKT